MNTNTQKKQGAIRDNIITLFEIDKLPEDQQEETIARIGKIIFQSVLIRVLPLLQEEDLAQYEKLVESAASPDVLLDFFFDKVPSFLEIVAQESENFRKDSAEILEQIK